MEESMAALEAAFEMYRQDLESYARTCKPLDGFLGFGRALKNEPCHDHFDARVKEAVEVICAATPTSEDAARAVGLLLRYDPTGWPQPAQWMLRAVERHTLPLIPFLAPETAAAFQKEYAARYKPWERFPMQKEVLKALKSRAGE
ncbi:MAG: hypothetical protein IJQ33_07590 [Clostridia bacterium]|nr:hypothetical protein [Clostridia bacterium]